MPYDSKRAVEIASCIQGWMRPDELAWLHLMASKIREGGTWIEIGSWKGRSTVATALGLPRGARLISVENYAGNAGSKVQGELSLPVPWVKWHFSLACRMIRELRPDVALDCIESSSADAAQSYPGPPADAIFIDGEHSYASAKQDILLWRRHIRPGGILCGHDRCHAGVRRALVETVASWESAPGSIWSVSSPERDAR